MKRLFFIKKNLRELFLLVLFFCYGFVSATDHYCDFEVNGIFYQFISGKPDEVAVSYDNYETGKYGGNYTNYTGSITVPATVVYHSKTYKVTAVTSHAFSECSVTSINLPNTITSIGTSAFLDCNQLFSINLPQTVTNIGASAFNGCVSLLSINIPSGVKQINSSTFQDCKSLQTITIPASVSSIDNNAFSGCSNLSSIYIPENIENVGNNAFYGTPWYNNQADGLIYVGKVAYKYKGTMPDNTEIVLKNNTMKIADYAFNGCSGLASITIPESVTTIGSYVFSDCSSLSSITIPENVTNFGNISSSSPFTGCSNLQEVTILCPTIPSYMFYNLSSLEKVTFGESVTTINYYAFKYCTALTTIEIPENVTSIGNGAFEYCSNLSTVTINNSHASIGSNAFYGTPWFENQPDGMIYIGNVAYKYKGAMPIDGHLTIKEGTEEIASEALNYCTDLHSINIPNSVKTIGSYAFRGCSGIASIILPNSITVIGPSAFDGCSGLITINIPNKITTISASLFAGCKGLTSVNIPASVTTIGSSAFSGCNGLTSINIPESVTSIESYAFNGCNSLSAVNITDLSSWCKINFGSSSNPLSLAKHLYLQGEEIVNLIIPDDITSINSYTFQGCSSLKSVTFHRNVTSINDASFADCPITMVVANMLDPISISASAFSNYTNGYISNVKNITLYVPKGSKEAYQNASVWQDFKEIKEFYKPLDISEYTDVIYAESINCTQGDNCTLTISLKNEQIANAYTFDLVLPEGVAISKDNWDEYVIEMSNRHNGHLVSVDKDEATGIYNFSVFSLQSNEIKENDGIIWKLKLKVANEVEEGDYVIKIQNAQYSLKAENSTIPMPSTVSLLTVNKDKKGDMNDDGFIDISDVVILVNKILNQ